ncbi:hypothetical protein JCGZ_10933 [Jatropha curcas]|uniref:Uncharacterized protein n=1 Tax=Jatropha curcas TaxID=180498 RepID=A0A067KGW7_JATCU|nr:hypothetical protein JCGZ_10933 [Jatropha curcas]
MDRTLTPVFEALFRGFSHKDWDLLSPFEVDGLSYYQNIQVQPGLLQWLINHFDSLDNLFHYNDFEICPLFEEFSIISRRIPMVEEIAMVPRLDIFASLILPVFVFSAYEITSYDFGVDVIPLRLLVDCAMSMDRTRPFWPFVVCFCLLSHYLLLSGIDGYDSLRLVPIVEQMARRRTPFSLIWQRHLLGWKNMLGTLAWYSVQWGVRFYCM